MTSDTQAARTFLRVRTREEVLRDRFTLSIRKSPAEEARDRAAAKAATRRALGLDR